MENELNTQEMDVESAKASLGLSTRLSEEFLLQQAIEQGETGEEAPVELETAPTSPVEPEVEEKPVEEEKAQGEGKMGEDMESMRTDIELLKKLVLKN